MTRNLKALGLALVAAFAMSAVAASAASAQNGVLTSDGPVTLRATQTGEASANSYTAFGLQSYCPEATGVGHEYNTTPHEFIESGSSTATMSPSNVGRCLGGGVFPATVDMNGCDGVYHIEETVGEDEYATREQLICPEGNHINLTLFSSESKHLESNPFCITTVTENEEGYSGLVAQDTTNGYIDVTGTIEGILIHRESPTGSILCTTGTTESGVIHVDGTGEGLNEKGRSTAVSLSHE
jgi:hypothetical protein